MTLLQNLGSTGFGADANFLIPLLIWSIIWKGIALWKAGRNGQLYWFLAILIINTAGILEIAYILWFQRKRINQ